MLEQFEFIFWEALKSFALIVLALMACKAARPFAPIRPKINGRGLILWALILSLIVFGARAVGEDVAAEVYGWASQRNLDHLQYALAYSNAVRAIDLRPGILRYWQLLARAKFAGHDFHSLLRDEPAVEALSPRGLDEDDLLRFAYCYYFTGEYDEVIALTGQFIRRNPAYPKIYVLQGLAEIGLRQYAKAEGSFSKALQLLPTQADAVEGLAQAYFLGGNTGAALTVLQATSHYSFPPETRARFQALNELYAQ